MMRSKLILLFIAAFTFKNLQAQDFIFKTDDISVKERCYLWVCSDQLSTGLARMTHLKFDSSTIRQSRIVPLKSKGLNEDLHFFRFIVNANGIDEFEYVFCYNHAYGEFYRIGKFMYNDYDLLFGFMKSHGGLNKAAIKTGKVYVEGVDMPCLFDLYNSKSKSSRKTVTDTDRLRYKCLQYNYEPIVVY